MSNELIRKAARSRGVYLWQIADKLGMNDGNFSRKLRREFTEEEQRNVLRIIDEIAKESET